MSLGGLTEFFYRHVDSLKTEGLLLTLVGYSSCEIPKNNKKLLNKKKVVLSDTNFTTSRLRKLNCWNRETHGWTNHADEGRSVRKRYRWVC